MSSSVEDAYGNLVTGYGGEVTIGLVPAPAGAALGGAVNVAASGGVAAFSGLSIDQAGAGYTLQAGAQGLSSANSSALAVTPAAPAQLVVSSEPPSSVAAGSGFGLTVAVEDAYGNLVTGFGSAVTIGLVAGPSAGDLGGSLTATVSGGVATFSGLSIDLAGSGYAVQATATGLAPATTTSVGVTPAAPAQLVIPAGPPPTLAAGSPFGLAVSVEDVYGNLVTGYGGEVTVGLAGEPDGVALGGVLTVPAIGGMATFGGLDVTESGSGYTIAATGAGLTIGRFERIHRDTGGAGEAGYHHAAAERNHGRRPVRTRRLSRGCVRQPRDRL